MQVECFTGQPQSKKKHFLHLFHSMLTSNQKSAISVLDLLSIISMDSFVQTFSRVFQTQITLAISLCVKIAQEINGQSPKIICFISVLVVKVNAQPLHTVLLSRKFETTQSILQIERYIGIIGEVRGLMFVQRQCSMTKYASNIRY